LSLTLLTFNFVTVNTARSQSCKKFSLESQRGKWQVWQPQMCNRLYILLCDRHVNALTEREWEKEWQRERKKHTHNSSYGRHTHAKSLLKQKVVKSKRNQFSWRL